MSNPQLTPGGIASLYYDTAVKDGLKPVVQIIDLKKITGPNQGGAPSKERYRVIISDGQFYQQVSISILSHSFYFFIIFHLLHPLLYFHSKTNKLETNEKRGRRKKDRKIKWNDDIFCLFCLFQYIFFSFHYLYFTFYLFISLIFFIFMFNFYSKLFTGCENKSPNFNCLM